MSPTSNWTPVSSNVASFVVYHVDVISGDWEPLAYDAQVFKAKPLEVLSVPPNWIQFISKPRPLSLSNLILEFPGILWVTLVQVSAVNEPVSKV